MNLQALIQHSVATLLPAHEWVLRQDPDPEGPSALQVLVNEMRIIAMAVAAADGGFSRAEVALYRRVVEPLERPFRGTTDELLMVWRGLAGVHPEHLELDPPYSVPGFAAYDEIHGTDFAAVARNMFQALAQEVADLGGGPSPQQRCLIGDLNAWLWLPYSEQLSGFREDDQDHTEEPSLSDRAPLWAFEVLGVEPGATEAELRQAYQDLVQVWHPDRFQHNPRLQARAEGKMKEINAAFGSIRIL